MRKMLTAGYPPGYRPAMKAQQLIDRYGSQSAAARALGVGRAAVNKWVKKGVVPELTAYKLQVVTKGKLKVEPELHRQ